MHNIHQGTTPILYSDEEHNRAALIIVDDNYQPIFRVWNLRFKGDSYHVYFPHPTQKPSFPDWLTPLDARLLWFGGGFGMRNDEHSKRIVTSPNKIEYK